MLELMKVLVLICVIEIFNLIGCIGFCSVVMIIVELGILKSMVYLLLGELKKQCFISMDNQDNYCLWIKLVELVGQVLSKMDLCELVWLCFIWLMDECGLFCYLGIIDQGNVYYILKIEFFVIISVCLYEGKSLFFYCFGIGKCLLVWQFVSVQVLIIEDLQWEWVMLMIIIDV